MSTKRVLIYGGNGALGVELVKHFKAKNFWIGSIDVKENQEADANVIVDINQDWQTQSDNVTTQVKGILRDDKLDAIFNVAGGWAGGNAASSDFIKNSDLMWKQSVWSSTITAQLAVNFLKENGVLTLPGAGSAISGTPGMIGYGMAKAAVHHLTKSLADKSSGLPLGVLVAAILPVTLDTPMNRKWMPKADFSTWTPLTFVARLFEKWLENEERPTTGSWVKLDTIGGETKTTIV